MMAGRGSAKRSRRSNKDKARRRRAIGLGGGAGAFLAFGLSPLGSVAPAHADGLDVIIDPIINSILNSVTDSVAGLDALAGVDPTAGLDLAVPTADLGGLALPATDAVAAWDPVAAAASAAAPAASTSLAGLYDQFIYDPSHTWDQQWIAGTTFLGTSTGQYDNFVNSLGFGLLIGNGADGIDGGTLAQADGAAGGLWFGDGGDGGADSAAIRGDCGGA